MEGLRFTWQMPGSNHMQWVPKWVQNSDLFFIQNFPVRFHTRLQPKSLRAPAHKDEHPFACQRAIAHGNVVLSVRLRFNGDK